MDKLIDEIKIKTGNSKDLIYKSIKINNKTIYLIFSEVLTSGEDINNFILKNISKIIDFKIDITNGLFEFFYNSIPSHNVSKVSNIDEILNKIFNGYVVFIEENNYFAMEMRASLDRGVSNVVNEISLRGPKDAFTENFNKNLGLLRRRIKCPSLFVKDLEIGKQTKTKVGIAYMNNICKIKNVDLILEKLSSINIDGIIDASYLKDYLSSPKNLFPTVVSTERVDVASQALLEGKIVIITDNSPYCLILPSFFIDFFHTPDDYYQKEISISFLRIIKLIAFLIACFLPAYYIAITTHNHDAISTNLLLNFISQRQNVPFPALVEALLMTISFEILKESDLRMSSTMGTAVSILGGLILGDALVSAGIVSPIMIIVVATSMISGLIFSSVDLTSAIRFYRIMLMILAASLGLYGIFIGGMFLIIHLVSLKTLEEDYLAPFSPLIEKEQRDAIIKTNSKVKYRNPLLTDKNKVKGRRKWKKSYYY